MLPARNEVLVIHIHAHRRLRGYYPLVGEQAWDLLLTKLPSSPLLPAPHLPFYSFSRLPSYPLIAKMPSYPLIAKLPAILPPHRQTVNSSLHQIAIFLPLANVRFTPFAMIQCVGPRLRFDPLVFFKTVDCVTCSNMPVINENLNIISDFHFFHCPVHASVCAVAKSEDLLWNEFIDHIIDNYTMHCLIWWQNGTVAFVISCII